MKLNANVEKILAALEQNGHEAYAVGGCVRDSLMGRVPTDWDVCTSALPEEVARCFEGRPIIETGLKHGTLSVQMNGLWVEITTYRVDGRYTDNRRPDNVRFVPSLQEDLARRDFTINAIAFNPALGIADPYHGAADIKQKILRCVGNANARFQEDGLRVLRGLRFASRLGFGIQQATAAAMHQNKGLLAGIAPQRLSAELCGILQGAHIRAVLPEYTDVIMVILPEIGPMVGLAQNSPYHSLSVWAHTVESIAAIEPHKVLRLAMLFHDCGKPATHTTGSDGIDHFYGHAEKGAEIARAAMERLALDKRTIAAVTQLVKWHGVPIEPRLVKKWMNRLGAERFGQLLKVKAADTAAQAKPHQKARLADIARLEETRRAVLDEQQCFQLKNLAVNGRDLIAAGMAPGPEMGRALQRLLALVMEGVVPNERAALLQEALNPTGI